MVDLVWMAVLILALGYVLFTELKKHNDAHRFEKALIDGYAQFFITFSDGSSKCLDLTKAPEPIAGSPILRLQYNQEHWIVSLHFEATEIPEAFPTRLYLHIEGVGRVTLRKDRARSQHVMYRAAVLTPQSLHYVSRRAVIGG